ncbi:LacI family transcriptional regulator (plasmid) [Rhizobium grahamii CCGE 502]|uniref:LacI family transcriptional regulator n=1 Tax=Rhizobium grahamii CCGE 502 TaxID=990285 RepID=S3HN68_9HYPH|nr:LacI family transcriptional regulator [Rhizobium grahamii CCGE 502]
MTVADVARSANVSKATAARVLGGYGTVSDKIREQVTTAASALGYRPNELARSMTTGRSGTIGVIVGDIENAFFSLAVRGISDSARNAGFNVIIANSGEELQAEKSAIDLLIGRRVDGLIVTPSDCRESDHLSDAIRVGVPLILFDRTIPALQVDAVTGADREAAIAATRHLQDFGHRQIAYITAKEGAVGEFFTNEYQLPTSSVLGRVEGFLATQSANGVLDAHQLVRLGATDQKHTDAVVSHLLNGSAPPTAILASDSLVGLQVLRSLHALGMSVPEDISIISFFNADWTTVTTPPITVVDQPVYEMGRLAAERLIARIDGSGGPAEHTRLQTSLISRGSVGRPK